MSALEARKHLAELHAERLEAVRTGLVGNRLYRADLEEEIAALRHAYVIAAVTEIASLRGELFGPQLG